MKKVARVLLTRLKELLVLNWRQKSAARSQLKMAIEDTLDYKAVSKRLIQFVSESSYGLVETLAEECAKIIVGEFNVERVRLKLRPAVHFRNHDAPVSAATILSTCT